jgi:hypothetical protein
MIRKIHPNQVVFVTGLALTAAGAYLVYPPAGLIVAGLVLMGISVFGDRKE